MENCLVVVVVMCHQMENCQAAVEMGQLIALMTHRAASRRVVLVAVMAHRPVVQKWSESRSIRLAPDAKWSEIPSIRLALNAKWNQLRETNLRRGMGKKKTLSIQM